MLLSGNSQGIRFATLSNLCNALDCKPNDLLEVVEGEEWQQVYDDDEWREDREESREKPKTIRGKVWAFLKDF